MPSKARYFKGDLTLTSVCVWRRSALMNETSGQWWRDGIIYQIYVRSWADSNRDGNGDIRGIIEHLDYLSDLGVDGIWLSPIMPSPNHDWGYDVSNYLDVASDYGTLSDLSDLINQARSRGIGILLDLVPNHCSMEHHWFREARTSLDSPYRDYFIWADPDETGNCPNNWIDATGASAWTLDPSTNQFYLHNFLESQPDLNWWNPEVHARFEEIIRFWFDFGIAGFRIDVAHGLYKDRFLRDDPFVIDSNSPDVYSDHGEIYSKNRPEVHELYKNWRRIADSYKPPRLLLGETWIFDPERLVSYYGENDELNLAFNFIFVFSDFTAKALEAIISKTLSVVPNDAVPVWTASNHDISRFPTRWANGDERKVRLSHLILATLPGTLVLYYGDELGLCDVNLSASELRDPMTAGIVGAPFKRDRARTPMPWNDSQGRGFCEPSVRPWLPFSPNDGLDVEAELKDPGSTLNLCKNLITIRRTEDFGTGKVFEVLPAPEDVLSYQIGEFGVVANMSEEPCFVDLSSASLVLGTSLIADPKPDMKCYRIDPWSGVLVKGTFEFLQSD